MRCEPRGLIACVFGLLILIGGGIASTCSGTCAARSLRRPCRRVSARATSDISPGIAGTLIDERRTCRMSWRPSRLGRKGDPHQRVQTPGVLGFGGSRDFVVERQESDAPLSTFEQTLLNTIFMSGEHKCA